MLREVVAILELDEPREDKVLAAAQRLNKVITLRAQSAGILYPHVTPDVYALHITVVFTIYTPSDKDPDLRLEAVLSNFADEAYIKTGAIVPTFLDGRHEPGSLLTGRWVVKKHATREDGDNAVLDDIDDYDEVELTNGVHLIRGPMSREGGQENVLGLNIRAKLADGWTIRPA
ncbi:hypothetical protein [Agromyces humi]|uniref:hypothetical protein n=1 Tax=Agromyces humi TaxID=1766800 RepID=UPI001358BC7E|nr:hypothetical protein [Agromyces humi]